MCIYIPYTCIRNLYWQFVYTTSALIYPIFSTNNFKSQNNIFVSLKKQQIIEIRIQQLLYIWSFSRVQIFAIFLFWDFSRSSEFTNFHFS